MDKMKDYEVVGGFDCGDRCIVVVRAAHATHVMPSDEWESIKQGLSKDRIGSHAKREKYKVA